MEASKKTGFFLQDAPRSLQPNPGLFFSAPSHEPVWKVLRTSLVRGDGVIVIGGHPGVGKSLLLVRLQGILPANRDMTLISDPDSDPNQFLQELIRGIGPVAPSDPEKEQNLTPQDLFDALERRAAGNRKQLVAVDQAETLTAKHLEYLSMAVQFADDGQRPVQVLLTGRFEPTDYMSSPAFRYLAGAVVGSGDLTPLTSSETREYVRFYLKKRLGQPLRVTRPGMNAIHRFSRGLPGEINLLMQRLLLRVKEGNLRFVGRWTVRRVVSDILGKPKKTKKPKKKIIKRNIPWASILLALPIVGFLIGQVLSYKPSPTPTETLLESEKNLNMETVEIIQPARKVLKPNEPATQEAEEKWNWENKITPPSESASPQVSTPVKSAVKAPPQPVNAKPRLKGSLRSSSSAKKTIAPRKKSVPTAKPQKSSSSSLSWQANTPAKKHPQTSPIVSQPIAVIPQTEDEGINWSTPASSLGSVEESMAPSELEITESQTRGVPSRDSRESSQNSVAIPKALPVVPRGSPVLATEETLRAKGLIYVVQIGSYINRANAEQVALGLMAKGLHPYVHLFQRGNKRWYSARLNYRDRNMADRMAQEIKRQEKLPVQVIPLYYE
ncbi:MAG: AAA family ATPase [Magnetococcales bacterium]|nr:AAA family ATPase [Magnetococcales bacterium]